MKYKIGDIVKINFYYIGFVKSYYNTYNDVFYNQKFIIEKIDSIFESYKCIPVKYNTNIKLDLYEHEIILDLVQLRKNKLKRIFNEI